MEGEVIDKAKLAAALLPEPLVLDIPEAALVLKIGESTVRRQIDTGVIPSVRIGERILVPVQRLRQMLNAQPGVMA